MFVFNICIYLGNWQVEEAICKISGLLDQHPQRNYLSKLTTFGHICQLPHSALQLQCVKSTTGNTEHHHNCCPLMSRIGVKDAHRRTKVSYQRVFRDCKMTSPGPGPSRMVKNLICEKGNVGIGVNGIPPCKEVYNTQYL